MRINEIFYSIQGETKDVGSPTIFVRTQFCPLRCTWCDTKDSWEKGGGVEKSVASVLTDVHEYPLDAKICITGGEPLRQFEEVIMLIKAIKFHTPDRYFSIETDGQEPIEVIQRYVNTVVMDYKVNSSGMNKAMDVRNLRLLRPQDQIKFIIWVPSDFEQVRNVIHNNDIQAEVLIGVVEGMKHPTEETLDAKRVTEWIKGNFPKARFQTQLHKHIYGNVRGV